MCAGVDHLISARLRLNLPIDHFIDVGGDINIHVVDSDYAGNVRIPLLCLPGLTRNARDFEPVFETFASQRRIIAVDFRGRGLSTFAGDASTYRPDVELADTLAVLNALDVGRVAVLGTSRGGIVGMLMAHTARQNIVGLCLNDIGPAVEAAGLLRIMGYVGTAVQFRSWDEAATALAAVSQGFAAVAHQQWLQVAKRIFCEADGVITHSHDLRLSQSLPPIEDVREGKLADLWSLVPALQKMPIALLRGTGSDLLSVATVERMQSELQHLSVTEVANRGHVPFLDEPESVAAITSWLAEVDANKKARTNRAF